MNRSLEPVAPVYRTRPANYDKHPFVAVTGWDTACSEGWAACAATLKSAVQAKHAERAAPSQRALVIAVETYVGVHDAELLPALQAATGAAHVIQMRDWLQPETAIETLVSPFLGGEDPLFGVMTGLELSDFLRPETKAAVTRAVAEQRGTVLVYGCGALLACDPDLTIYADMPRWEGQLRQRRGEVSNLGTRNAGLKASLQYKRAFFIDWRVCDRLKQRTFAEWDFFLDSTIAGEPKLLSGEALRAGLKTASKQPLRVVPFFDPAPWGGHWMQEVCDLDRNQPNFGWCFDCVPEENSLVLAYGATRVEMPAANLVFAEPRALLGEAVYQTFGAEFPIRFDFLDTMGGSSLSLQVHPVSAFAKEKFGLQYTQDESYYILAAEPGAVVYLGRKTGTDPKEMWQALAAAQAGGPEFPAADFVNVWPAHAHDHFLIPAGTVHCSGPSCMVLEISATPYIFTFKLWDWGRMGLDGKPRPINLARGQEVLLEERNTELAKRELINHIEPVAAGPGWREERTGLHSAEFIETRRHWFTGTVTHETGATVNVLNLVAGDEAIVESPSGAFAAYIVHYAETFIVPANVGTYTIRPHGPAAGTECATIKAFVRKA